MNKAYQYTKFVSTLNVICKALKIQIRQYDHLSISSAYECLLEELCMDGLEVSIVHLIRLTIDGLYYAKRLNIAPITDEAAEGVFEQLMQMTWKD
ncbi:hypothetical protein [Lysinibacillus sp. RS5]|uniref:hypothetical protein n=1 Tax=unclassified Lysinibacillus TaxID=2636778 RepID=UPI0035BE8CB3